MSQTVVLRYMLLKETHYSKQDGHPRLEKTYVLKTYVLLARCYFWMKIKEDVEVYVKTCLVRQQDKTEKERK